MMNLFEKYKAMVEPEGEQGRESAPPHPGSVSPQTKEDAMSKYIWKNPYPKESPEAQVVIITPSPATFNSLLL